MIAGRLRKGEPERGAEIGRSARGGENVPKTPWKKSRRNLRACSSRPVQWRPRLEGYLENAEEIESEKEDDRAHCDDKIWVGELKGPGDFTTGRFESDHEQRQSAEPGEDADGES